MKLKIDEIQPANLEQEISEQSKEIDRQSKEIAILQETVNRLSRASRNYRVALRSPHTSIKFGLCGDTQVGSVHSRMDAFNEFCYICKCEGIHDILHTGDVLEGVGVYRGQEYEVSHRGFDEQFEHLKDTAPRHGQSIHFITGNHDWAFKKAAGIDPGPVIGREVPGWNYLGRDYGRIVLVAHSGQSCIVDLFHPGGGTAYAISYRTQKIIESISGGTKPHIIGIGHYHKADVLPSYRNVCGIQTGCFQSQTAFMQSKSSAAHVGGYIVEVCVGGDMTTRIKTEWIGFFEPKQ